MKFNTLAVREVIDALMPLVPGLQEQFVRLGNRSKHGLTVELKPIRMKHSQQQQGYYWRSLHAFGRHLGYSAHESETLLHPAVCAAAFGLSDHREIHIQGRTYQWPVPRETSSKDADGNVRDMETYSTLIETLIRFAAEHGYVVEEAA